jgi:hypothetical protein
MYQPSQTTTLEDALKYMKRGRQLQLQLFIKEAIDVHVMTGGDTKSQRIYQALRQWPSFSTCIYFTHPELTRPTVSKMRNYKNNNRTRNFPLNFSQLTGDCASAFGQFISNNNNWYKLPTGQGMIPHFVDLYELADHVGIQRSELDRVLYLERPTREQIVKFVKDGTNTNIKLKPDDVETDRCTCVATSFLLIYGILKFRHENRGIALPRSFDGIFKLIKDGIYVGVFGYQAPRWDNDKNKNSVSVYIYLLVVTPGGEKTLLPVITLVALENFLKKLTRNPGFKMDWTHCALDHNAAVCEGLALTRDVFKKMPLQEPSSYQVTAIVQPCYFHVKQWLKNKKVELVGRHYALIEEQFSYIRCSPSFAYHRAADMNTTVSCGVVGVVWALQLVTRSCMVQSLPCQPFSFQQVLACRVLCLAIIRWKARTRRGGSGAAKWTGYSLSTRGYKR